MVNVKPPARDPKHVNRPPTKPKKTPKVTKKGKS